MNDNENAGNDGEQVKAVEGSSSLYSAQTLDLDYVFSAVMEFTVCAALMAAH